MTFTLKIISKVTSVAVLQQKTTDGILSND